MPHTHLQLTLEVTEYFHWYLPVHLTPLHPSKLVDSWPDWTSLGGSHPGRLHGKGQTFLEKPAAFENLKMCDAGSVSPCGGSWLSGVGFLLLWGRFRS